MMETDQKKIFKIPPDDVNEIPLKDVVELIQDKIPEQSKIDLTILASGLVKDQVTNTVRHRFEFKVCKDLNSIVKGQDGAEHSIVTLGKLLLNNTYKDKDDQEQIEKIFKLALSVPEKYMMVTLIGEAIANKEILCVAVLLGIWSEKGLYITHLSVSDQFFSRTKFGQRGDSNHFNTEALQCLQLQ